ncbi:hypothetical protein EXN66_Car000492 [Channa argus]|uniref:Uncharacterized protein n=1 Tax=Channa argus TaxID=215402 RepID=A0A6G1QYC8_CHAAH|nr:hypothetical protein EXN66_Car000492 [Channa argus]
MGRALDWDVGGHGIKSLPTRHGPSQPSRDTLVLVPSPDKMEGLWQEGHLA